MFGIHRGEVPGSPGSGDTQHRPRELHPTMSLGASLKKEQAPYGGRAKGEALCILQRRSGKILWQGGVL